MPRILVIDDSALIRGLVCRGLRPFAEVDSAADAEEALARFTSTAHPSSFDLLIVDSELRLAEGLALLPELKRCLGAPILALMPPGNAAAPAGSDEILRKPFFLRELEQRVRRMLPGVPDALRRVGVKVAKSPEIAPANPAPESPAAEGLRSPETVDGGRMRGALGDMSVVDLLQALDLGRKSCCLTVTLPAGNGSSVAEPCRIYLVEGRVVHAAWQHLTGEEAVYEALCAGDEGSFEIEFGATTDLRTSTSSTESILLEAMRRLDERNRDAAEGESE